MKRIALRQEFKMIILLFVFSLSGCTKEPVEPLHVATNVWTGYEPLYLARSLGYFSDDTVRLHELPNSSDVIKAFRNKAVDVAALTLDEALLLLQDGIAARILLIMDVSNGADVVMARPEIRTIKDLKGRRVGVESLAEGAYMLSRSLEKGGLEPGDIRVVYLALNEHENAYSSGQVDAVVTFEPVRTKLLARGAHVIFDSSRIPNEIFDVLVIQPGMDRRRPKELRQLEDGWYRSVAYLRANPVDACQRMAKREGLTPEQFQLALNGLNIPDKVASQRLLNGAILATANRLVDVMLQDNLLRSKVDPSWLLGPAAQTGRTHK